MICRVQILIAFAISVVFSEVNTSKYQQFTSEESQKIVAVLNKSKGNFSDELRETYCAIVENRLKKETDLPASFWNWLESRSDIRYGLLSSGFPVKPSVPKNLHTLREELGNSIANKYTGLLLACAVALKDSGVEYGSYKYHLEKKYVPGQNPEIDRDIEVLHKYIVEKEKSLIKVAEDWDNIKKSLPFEGSYKGHKEICDQYAMAKGVYGERHFPKLTDFLEYLISHDTLNLPKFNDGEPEWPCFPLKEAPWPLLMPFSETRPLEEAEFIWSAFKGDTLLGSNRLRVKTYGQYTKDWNNLDRVYKKSSMHPAMTYMRILEDGGVCGRMSAFGRNSYISRGVPATQMGQPAHSALIRIRYSDISGRFFAAPEQSGTVAAKSETQWYFDNCDNIGSNHKEKFGHQVVDIDMVTTMTHAVSKGGLESYLDTRNILSIYRNLPAENEKIAVTLLENAPKVNHSNAEIWHELAANVNHSLRGTVECIKKMEAYFVVPEGEKEDRDDKTLKGVRYSLKNKILINNAQNVLFLAKDEKLLPGYSELDSALTYVKEVSAEDAALKNPHFQKIYPDLIIELSDLLDQLDPIGNVSVKEKVNPNIDISQKGTKLSIISSVNSEIQIVNLQGQILHTEFLDAGKRDISIKDLSKGVFFLNVFRNNGELLTRKIINR